MNPETHDRLADLAGEFVPDAPVLRVTTLNTVWLLRPEPLGYMRLPRHETERSLLPDGYGRGRLEDHVWHDAVGMSFEHAGRSCASGSGPPHPTPKQDDHSAG